MKKKFAAITALGKDRPGIVASLAKALFESGCNLEDSSMTRLKGDFAVLLLVSFPGNTSFTGPRASLEGAAKDLGLTLQVRELAPEEAEPSPDAPSLPHTLIVYGVDHPGIVHRVAQTASENRANITDLRTHVTRGKDAPLYSLTMDLDLPDQAAADSLGKALDALKKDLKVEIAFRPMEADEL